MKTPKYFLVAYFILLGISEGFCGPPPPGGTPGCWPPPCIPVDGGVTFLIAAGAAYGVKKLASSSNKKQKI